MNSDLKYKFLHLIGVISDKEKLIHKYQSINEKVEPGIDHYNSIHTRSLQVSKYLCIDDRTDKKYVIETQSKRLFAKRKQKKEKEE